MSFIWSIINNAFLTFGGKILWYLVHYFRVEERQKVILIDLGGGACFSILGERIIQLNNSVR